MPTIVTPPTREPITLSQAKDHIRFDESCDDAYISTLISVSRQYIESVTNRQLMTATWNLFLDEFPKSYFEVPKAPLQSVSSIQYLDELGATQTLATTVYEVDNKKDPAKVILSDGQSWPETQNVSNAVTVAFIAGYTDRFLVPDSIKHAMKLLMAHLYENREPVIVGTQVSDVPMSVDMLLTNNRVFTF